jgi:hypothetical protein
MHIISYVVWLAALIYNAFLMLVVTLAVVMCRR